MMTVVKTSNVELRNEIIRKNGDLKSVREMVKAFFSKTSKFAKKCMVSSVQQSIHLLLNFEVFEWLYLVQYWPN